MSDFAFGLIIGFLSGVALMFVIALFVTDDDD